MLPPSPLSDDFSQSAIYIFPGFPAFLRVISSGFEHEFYQQAGADQQHAPQHKFRENKVFAVRIEQEFQMEQKARCCEIYHVGIV